MAFACVFPGQGAQKVGMMASLAEAHPEIEETFAEASEALDEDLWELVSEGPAEQLNQTRNSQPVLLAAEISIWRVWRQHGGPLPAYLAGHSFGEYSALVAAGALEFSSAAPLVRLRGDLMQQAVETGVGSMAAVLGLEDGEVRDVCAQISSPDAVVETANFNAPGQVVLSGHRSAVERATEACREAGARRAMLLDVSVPAHSSLMRPAVDHYAEALEAVEFTRPEISVVNNVDVSVETAPERIRDALKRQLYSPVRWTESILWMAEHGVGMQIEMGPGKILTGLSRRISKSVRGLCLESPDSLEQALGEIGNAG